jgi:hypothetical protein
MRVEVSKSPPETIVASSLASGDHSLLLVVANLLSNKLDPELCSTRSRTSCASS